MSKTPQHTPLHSTGPVPTDDDVVELYQMLQYQRPHQSSGEEGFIKRFLLPHGVQADSYGNLSKRIGTAPVAWSSHTDTVHGIDGFQNIAITKDRVLKLKNGETSSCLGADDTAGVWLMIQMMRAQVPGLYIFHRGEEVGCKGSEWIVKHTPDLVKDVKCMIALDRKDTDNLITHQRGYRCCSEDFGKSLADELNGVKWDEGVQLKYRNDDTGMYTDSATYTKIVAECTNLSVGYSGQHGRGETLMLDHLLRLREALVRMDLSKLRYSRQPGDVESKYKSWSGSDSYYYGRGWYERVLYTDGFCTVEERYILGFLGGYWCQDSKEWQDMDRAEWMEWRKKMVKKGSAPAHANNSNSNKSVVAITKKTTLPAVVPKVVEASEGDFTKVVDLVRANPSAIAGALLDWGFDHKLVEELVIEYEYNLFDKSNKTAREEDKPPA